MGNDDCLALTGLRLRIFKAIGVTAAVAEFERIGDKGRKVNACIGTIIKKKLQPLLGIDPIVARNCRVPNIRSDAIAGDSSIRPIKTAENIRCKPKDSMTSPFLR